jgi:CheY-like chemotaxis protein
MMPKMSGVDVLDSLQALLSDPSVRTLTVAPAIVVITATASSVLPSEILAQRFPTLVKEVFRKPLDIHALAESVERHLGCGRKP